MFRLLYTWTLTENVPHVAHVATPRKACNVRYFYVRNRHPALRHSRFASAHCQRPAPAGRWQSRREKRESPTLKRKSATSGSRWIPDFGSEVRIEIFKKNKAARCLVWVQGLFSLGIYYCVSFPWYSHLASKVRYISFQRNLQLKIHLSSYPKC